MLKYVKQLGGESLIYGLSGIISSFISIFLFPIYTKLLLPADYGVLAVINTTFLVVNIFLILALDNSAQYWYWKVEEVVDRKKTFASWFWFLLFFSFGIGLLVFLLSAEISQLLLGTEKYYGLIRIAAGNIVFFGAQRVINNWFRTQRLPMYAVIFTSSVALTTVGLTIYFVVLEKLGVSGILTAQLITSLLAFCAIVILMRNWLNFSFFSLLRLKEMILYSYPLVPASFLYWLLNSASIYFIQFFVDKSEVGLYQIGLSLSAILNLISGSFLQAWSPFAMSISKQEDAKNIYANVLGVYVFGAGLAAVGLFLFAPELLMLFTNANYFEAKYVVGLLGFNVFLLGIPQIVCIGSAIMGENKSFGIAVFCGAIVSMSLFFVLIPNFGKEGAAISTLIGNIVVIVVVSYKNQQINFIPYNFSLSAKFISLAFCFCLIGAGFFFRLTILDFSIRLFLFIGFIAGLAIYQKQNLFLIINKLKNKKVEVV